MGLQINIDNEKYAVAEKQINRECKKLERYFNPMPIVHCKVVSHQKGIDVKISLDTGHKFYSGDAQGMQISLCITKAIKRLMRSIEHDKGLQMRRDEKRTAKVLHRNLTVDARSRIN